MGRVPSPRLAISIIAQFATASIGWRALARVNGFGLEEMQRTSLSGEGIA